MENIEIAPQSDEEPFEYLKPEKYEKPPKPENRYTRKKKQRNWISKSLLNIPQIAGNAFGDSKPESKTPQKETEKPAVKIRYSSAGSKSNLTNSTKKRFTLSPFTIFEFGKKNDQERKFNRRDSHNTLQRSFSVGNNLLKEDDEVFLEGTQSFSDDQHSPLSDPTTRKFISEYHSDDSSSGPTVTPASTESDRTEDDFDQDVIAKRKHGLKHLSRSTPTMSPSGSPPHSDSEGGQSHISRRTKKFLRRFRSVSHTEKVVNYYACAIVSDILLQGTLYITENYFAFYSNIFGYVNRTLIPIAEVSSIQKEKTAKFIPNAVGLHTIDGKTYVFSSLISRDATYKFMTHMWKKSRNPTDSDMEANIPPPEEQFSDSGSISGDSAVEDNIDYPADTYDSTSVTDHTAPVWHKISPMAIADIKPLATSGTNSENDSTYTTPETCLSSSSVNGVRSTLDPLGTSASESEVTVKKRENITPKVVPSSGKTNPEENRKKPWSVRTNIFNTVINLGVAPFRAVKDGLQEVAFMPNNSALLIASSSLVLLLLLSALFMIYKVETLSYQLNEDTLQYGDLYEEVLRMQQKIHAATAKEIESTLNQQIRQLVTVKQSLEALIFLLDSNRSSHSSPVSENSY